MSRNGTTASPTRPRWRVQGISVQGYSHLRDGVECQDAYRHAAAGPSHAQVLAVADGAGSRTRSAEGAALAVGLATARFADRLASGNLPDTADRWRDLLSGCFGEVLTSFLDAVDGIGPDPREFAATLTAVVLAHPWIGVVSVGDGFVVARADGHDRKDHFHLVSFAGDAGKHVNETTFLTSAGARAKVSVDCLYDPGLSAVLLATDGLVPAATKQTAGVRRPNRSFLEPLLDALDEPADIARLLLDDRISALSADDKTLLVAVPS